MRPEPADTTPEQTTSGESTPTVHLDQEPATNSIQAAATSEPAQPVAQPDLSHTKGSSKKKWIIAAIIAVVLFALIGGGSAYAYFGWYQNPDKVVHDAMINALQAKTVTGTADLSVSSDDVNMKLKFGSKANGQDGQLDVQADVDVKADAQKIALKLNGSGVAKGDTVYFKLDGVKEAVDEYAKSNDVEVPEYVSTIINKIDDKWISVAPGDYEDMSKEYSDTQKCVADLNKRLGDDDNIRSEIADLYKNNQILVVKKSLGSKNINGQGSLGYEIDANEKALESFVRGLADTTYGKELKKCDEDIDFTTYADSIAEASKDASESDVTGTAELWASRFGHEITEFSVNAKNADATVNFALNPVFNKTVTVDAPEGAISLKDLTADIQKGMEQSYAEMYNYDYDPQDAI